MQRIPVHTAIDELSPESLKGGSIFGALSSEAIRFLLEEGNVYRVKKNDLIYKPGDPGNSFFVVCKGAVDFHKQHLGEYAYTRTSQFGEEVGFVAMIGLHDHVGKAVAREDGILLEISSGLFRDLHDKFPFDFGVMILNLSRDLARVIRKLSNILVANAIEH
jgi:signal-transduction protein with cAMP-binding, CBS, and nucleotidyltransferase domain